jgi:SAM-dependent methyltransferase
MTHSHDQLGDSVIADLHARYQTYLATPIPKDIADCDDMIWRGAEGAMEQYMAAGRSAVNVVLGAMLATGRREFATTLDLPCGGGRVARHLRAFLPETALFVGELDEDKRRFVEQLCHAQRFDAPLDFRGTSERTFDLMWVGSLLTHFNVDLFTRAVAWFMRALAPDGILILTTHGRCQDYVHRAIHHHVDAAAWDQVCLSRDRTGFGFTAYDEHRPAYGLSLTAPSWVLRLVEGEPAMRIVSFGEAMWGGHQDVLVVQKRPAYATWELPASG